MGRLLAALHFFNNSLNTLTKKTIEDTLLTIRKYGAARVENDAYRSELESSGGKPLELLLANIERRSQTIRAASRRLCRQAQAIARKQSESDEQTTTIVPQRSVCLF